MAKIKRLTTRSGTLLRRLRRLMGSLVYLVLASQTPPLATTYLCSCYIACPAYIWDANIPVGYKLGYGNPKGNCWGVRHTLEYSARGVPQSGIPCDTGAILVNREYYWRGTPNTCTLWRCGSVKFAAEYDRTREGEVTISQFAPRSRRLSCAS